MLHLVLMDNGQFLLTDALDQSRTFAVMLPPNDAEALARSILQHLEARTPGGIIKNAAPILSPLGSPIKIERQ